MPLTTLINLFKKIQRKWNKAGSITDIPALMEEPLISPNLYEPAIVDNVIQLDEQKRKQWAFKKTLENHWNDADKLYLDIIDAHEKGMRSELLPPAQRLLDIDKDQERATFISGLILMQNYRFESAANLFEYFLRHHGSSPRILFYYAKTFADLNKVKAILWRTLELSPNFKAALDWWLDLQPEHNSTTQQIPLLKRVADLSDSWLAQTYIAVIYLKSKKISAAQKIYLELLEKFPNDRNLIANISAQLIHYNHLTLALKLALPFYKPEIHGVEIGLNFLIIYHRMRDGKAGLKLLKNMNQYVSDESDMVKSDLLKFEIYFESQNKQNNSAFMLYILATIFTSTVFIGGTIVAYIIHNKIINVSPIFYLSAFLLATTVLMPFSLASSSLYKLVEGFFQKKKVPFSYGLAFYVMFFACTLGKDQICDVSLMTLAPIHNNLHRYPLLGGDDHTI